MLRTASAPPPMGSLRESVLLMALMMQETVEHAKFRASAQLTLDGEKGMEAFEEYMKVAFPYLETQKKRDRQAHIALMNEEIRRGAIAVTPMAVPKMKSRLRTRVDGRRKVPRSGQDRLYDKLGRFNQ